MILHGPVRSYTVMYGLVRSYKFLYGHVCTYLNLYGPVWFGVFLYGFPMVLYTVGPDKKAPQFLLSISSCKYPIGMGHNSF